MKKVILAVCIVLAGVSAMAANPPVKKTAAPTTFNDSASYAIGCDMYNAWKQQNLGINYEMVANALIDCMGGDIKIDEGMRQMLLMRFQQEFERRMHASVQENIDKGKAFREANGKRSGVKTTESGLQYEMIKSGNGKKPAATDMVKVHYTGSLIDGTVFDSSVERGEPITFPLNQVIPGWSEGVQLMDEGSTYKLYIPYDLGYGEQAMPNIPAGSTLIFEVQLIKINPEQ